MIKNTRRLANATVDQLLHRRIEGIAASIRTMRHGGSARAIRERIEHESREMAYDVRLSFYRELLDRKSDMSEARRACKFAAGELQRAKRSIPSWVRAWVDARWIGVASSWLIVSFVLAGSATSPRLSLLRATIPPLVGLSTAAFSFFVQRHVNRNVSTRRARLDDCRRTLRRSRQALALARLSWQGRRIAANAAAAILRQECLLHLETKLRLIREKGRRR